MSASDRRVTVVSRDGCHLCEQAEQRLAELSAEHGFTLDRLDVDGDRTLANQFSDRVPVILIDGAEHGYWRLEEARFLRAIQQ